MSPSPHSGPNAESGTGVTIRPADMDDHARARAVQYSAGWKDAPERHRYWPAHDPDWVNRHYFREFVAEVEGVIAGRIGLEAFCPPFAELVNLCVLPEYRRLGLGQKLTAAAQRAAARMGFTALFLQTEIDNIAAHRLYAGQEWIPTAHGKMLRMVKLFDCPLLESFKREHPLNQYTSRADPSEQKTWIMEWNGYVTDDYLRFTLEGGASRSDSDGVGPAIAGLDWRTSRGARGLKVSIQCEEAVDIEPGNHVELVITATNTGERAESGVFQMALPGGVRLSEPETNLNRTFVWSLEPGETAKQPLVVQIERQLDAGALWYLNYASIPVSAEVYWSGHRALISKSLPMAAPPPTSR